MYVNTADNLHKISDNRGIYPPLGGSPDTSHSPSPLFLSSLLHPFPFLSIPLSLQLGVWGIHFSSKLSHLAKLQLPGGILLTDPHKQASFYASNADEDIKHEFRNIPLPGGRKVPSVQNRGSLSPLPIRRCP